MSHWLRRWGRDIAKEKTILGKKEILSVRAKKGPQISEE